MACSPVPSCSQSRQQQTAEWRLGSGVRETVEIAGSWRPVAWREVDSDSSKDAAVENAAQSFPGSSEGLGEDRRYDPVANVRQKGCSVGWKERRGCR